MKHSKTLKYIVVIFTFSLLFQLLYFNTPLLGEDRLRDISTLLSNQTLYKDKWMLHAPLAWHIYSFFLGFLGRSLQNLTIITFLINSITSVLIFLISKEVVRKKIAFIPSILFLLFGIPHYLISINPEIIFSLILSASIVMLINYIKYQKRVWFLVSALLCGALVAIKQNIGIYTMASFLVYFLFANKGRIRDKLKKILTYILLSLPIPIIILSYYFTHNALDQMYKQIIVWVFKNYTIKLYPPLSSLIWLFLVAFVLVLFLFAKKIFFPHKPRKSILLLLSILGLFLLLGCYPLYGNQRVLPAMIPGFVVLAYFASNYQAIKSTLKNTLGDGQFRLLSVALMIIVILVVPFNIVSFVYQDISFISMRKEFLVSQELEQDLINLKDKQIYIFPFEDFAWWMWFSYELDPIKHSFHWDHLVKEEEQLKVIDDLNNSKAVVLIQNNTFHVFPSKNKMPLLVDYLNKNYQVVKSYPSSHIIRTKPFLKLIATKLPFLYQAAPAYFERNINFTKKYDYVLMVQKD